MAIKGDLQEKMKFSNSLPVQDDLLTKEDLLVLVKSGEELAALVNLDTLLQRILAKACELTESKDSSVILHNETTNNLFFAAATRDKAEFLLRNWGETSKQQIPLQRSKAGQVFESGQPIIVNSMEEDPVHFKGADSDTSKQTDSMICVPLTAANQRIGVVQILNKKEKYTQRDLVLLEHFASQAAIAIRNARLFMDLIAHMGIYGSQKKDIGPLALFKELSKPACSEELSVMFADMWVSPSWLKP